MKYIIISYTYGHLAGDNCLRRVARALNEIISRPADLVARYGGEEFGVILPNTDSAGASKVAEILGEKIRSLMILHDFSEVANHITISMGVASRIACETTSPTELIGLADKALYKAKDSGRDMFIISD